MKEALEKLNEKLEGEAVVMKDMIKQLDVQVSSHTAAMDKLESEKAELLVEANAKLATAEEKLEAAEKAKVETDEKVAEIQETLEKVQDELNEYKEMGAAEEIKETMESFNATLETMLAHGTKAEIFEKLESIEGLKADLGKFESIGSVDEIAEVMGEYREMKFEASAIKLGAECGVGVAQARVALEKLESYDVAKEFIAGLMPMAAPVVAEKLESEEDAEGVAEKLESASASASQIQVMKNAIRNI